MNTEINTILGDWNTILQDANKKLDEGFKNLLTIERRYNKMKAFIEWYLGVTTDDPEGYRKAEEALYG